MANVRNFTTKHAGRSTSHSDVEATLSLVECGGEKFIQIDTFGSADRAIPGKVSQSLRISKSAYDELVQAASRYF